MTADEHRSMVAELGIDFTKYGYKPRPAFLPKGPTPLALIEQLASLGLTERQVMLTLGWGIGAWGTRKEADPEMMASYERGYHRGIAMVANRHFQSAMQGSIPAMQFILKTKGDFREPKEEGMAPADAAAQIRAFLGGVASMMPPAPPEPERADSPTPPTPSTPIEE